MNLMTRAYFLQARMAYLADMRDRGMTVPAMIDAVNIGDEGQVRLLLMTWDSLAEAAERERGRSG